MPVRSGFAENGELPSRERIKEPEIAFHPDANDPEVIRATQLLQEEDMPIRRRFAGVMPHVPAEANLTPVQFADSDEEPAVDKFDDSVNQNGQDVADEDDDEDELTGGEDESNEDLDDDDEDDADSSSGNGVSNDNGEIDVEEEDILYEPPPTEPTRE